jgi:hypothetical protein
MTLGLCAFREQPLDARQQKTPEQSGVLWTAPDVAGRWIGRGSRIRTDDHLSPRQVRYQAALYPGLGGDYTRREDPAGLLAA